MKEKKYLLVFVVLLMFPSGLVMANVPIKAQEPYVKVYVDQPLGYIPGVPEGGHVVVDICIEISGILDDSPEGIVGWALRVCVDPNVLEFIRATSGMPGYLLYDYGDILPPGYEPMLDIIPPQPPSGCLDATEVLFPIPPGGAGEFWSGYKLITILYRSKSEIAYSLIDLRNVEYMTPDAVWHPVDEAIDGHYNLPPVPEFPLGLALEILFMPVIIYIFWRSKQRKKLLH